jgi:hypothetical protein
MSGHNTEIKVKSHSGYVYAEEPLSFTWQEKELRTKSVEKTWQEPVKTLFKVVTQNGRLFEPCYSEGTDRWFAIELVQL